MKLIDAQIEYLQVLFYLLLFYIGKFFFNKMLDRFWKKNVETEYITTGQCQKHREEMEQADMHRHSELHKELKCSNQVLRYRHSLGQVSWLL